MPEFYNSIDIYACASLNEGTPNTVLESMACGIMVITTDVGIVRDALGPKQQQYVADRTVDDFYVKLKTLLDNKNQWSELSRENLEYIKSWDWTLKAQLIIDYFESLAVENDLL
jgi:glycosyltransferase involved in cell wall biosynthesis